MDATSLEWEFKNGRWLAGACVLDEEGVDVLARFEVELTVSSGGMFVGSYGKNRISCETLFEAKQEVKSFHDAWLVAFEKGKVAA